MMTSGDNSFRTRAVLLLLTVFCLLIGCRSTKSPSTSVTALDQPKNLPQFEVTDSDGKELRSAELAERPVIVAFFDPDSVLAWRTLSELGTKPSVKNTATFVVGFASRNVPSDVPIDIAGLKTEYQISFPIVPDYDNRFSKLFQSPSCCDSFEIYDTRGMLMSSTPLTGSFNKLDSLLAESSHSNTERDRSLPLAADQILTVKVTGESGNSEPLPTASNGLTVVNFFTEFCSECITGSRFQTLGRLNRSHEDASRLLLVFSNNHFSEADIQNFKAMLPMGNSMIRGDIHVIEPYLIQGKLLIVLDANKKVIWQENGEMTEDSIRQDVERLLQSNAN